MRITVHFQVGKANPHNLISRLVEKGMIIKHIEIGLGVIHGHLPERHQVKDIVNMEDVDFLSYNFKEEHREHPRRTLKEAREHALAVLLQAEKERDDLLKEEIENGERRNESDGGRENWEK